MAESDIPVWHLIGDIFTIRQVGCQGHVYDLHHPAILKMIQMVVDNAHKEGKWAGICGELGADMELVKTFVQMGVDELSVAPSMILKLRQIIREMD